MKSDKEKIFENHIAAYLKDKHRYTALSAADCTDTDFHFIASHLLDFIKDTQLAKYEKLQENYGSDADREILEALKTELERKPLWVIIRNNLPVRGIALICITQNHEAATAKLRMTITAKTNFRLSSNIISAVTHRKALIWFCS